MAPSNHRSSSRDLVWQQVHWPIPLDTEQALGLLRRLASDVTRQPVIWETRSTAGTVTHLFGTAAHQVREVTGVIETLVPSTATSPGGDARPTVARSARLEVKGQALRLDTEHAPHTARTLLAALTAARFTGEHAVIQIVLGRGRTGQLLGPKPADPTQSWFSLLTHGQREAPSELSARIKEKQAEAGFTAIIRVAVVAKSEGRRVAIMQGLLAALRTMQSPGMRLEFTRDTATGLNEATVPHIAALHLSASEALSLLAWPLEADDLPGLPHPHPKPLRLIGKDIETARTFALTSAPGQTRPLGIGIGDALFHTLALGPTGSGKSTALLNLIVADMTAGRTIVVVDPKSDLIGDILERVPEHRHRDVVVLDPTDSRPVGLNPLRVDGTSPELIADGILGIFRDLFPTAFGPRTSDVLHASLLTLAHHPGATLTWLPRLLTDAHFRATLTGNLNDPDGLEAFWAEYAGLSERQQAQFTGPVLSRLRQFLLRPSLKRVLDQADPKFHLEDIFNRGTILLVPLNTGVLGNDAARLLGSLLVTQLWQLTLARAQQTKDQRPPVSIYIDEMQEFLRLGGDLSDALARSRSLGVAWHLAHQYRDQLSTEMRAAVDANARNKIVFGVGIKDARDLAAMAPDLTPDDFLALPQYAVYANLMRHGRSLGWVSGQTLPGPPVTSDPVELVATSQQRYGRDPEPERPKDTSSARNPAGERSEGSIGRRRKTTP